MPFQTVNLLCRSQNGGVGALHQDVFWLLIGTNDIAHGECYVESIVAGDVAITEESQRNQRACETRGHRGDQLAASPPGKALIDWNAVRTLPQEWSFSMQLTFLRAQISLHCICRTSCILMPTGLAHGLGRLPTKFWSFLLAHRNTTLAAPCLVTRNG
jgi:hypothetical protein